MSNEVGAAGGKDKTRVKVLEQHSMILCMMDVCRHLDTSFVR